MKEIYILLCHIIYIYTYTLRKTLTSLKNLNHHDKNPAAPVQENNLTLMKKHSCPTENISTSPNKILQPHP